MMNRLKRFGLDSYMLLLLLMVLAGAFLPARGDFAIVLSHVTYWAVAFLFFLYGAKLDTAALRQAMTNLRLQLGCFAATWALFPLIGLGLAWGAGPLIGPELAVGLLFLSVLPSTVQSSIAFTSLARGNVAGAICAASLSNLAAVVLTPALMALILHRSGGISGNAVLTIFLQILLPFAIGQALRPWLMAPIKKRPGLTMIADRGSILLIVYAAFSAGTVAGLWQNTPLPRLLSLAAVILFFLLLMMLAMRLGARLLRLKPADQATLFFCGATKSLASGLPIATALFSPDVIGPVILPLMLYHLAQLLICAIIAQRWSQKMAAEPV